jgi:hypothetical protein
MGWLYGQNGHGHIAVPMRGSRSTVRRPLRKCMGSHTKSWFVWDGCMGKMDTGILPYPWGGLGRSYGDPSVNVWASIQTHGVVWGNMDTAILPYPWGGLGRWYGDPSVNVWASIQTHGLIFEIDEKTSRSNRPCFRLRRVKNTVVLTGAISTQGGTLGVMVPHTNFEMLPV